MERVQKIIAKAGIGSRRFCETLIAQGRVKINGRTAILGDKATPKESITVDGKKIQLESPVYIMLNKPQGFISSTVSNEHGEKTIMRLVRIKERIFPVGRLDKNSQGLMILTNDGELANRLTHPSFGTEKEYLVWTAQPFNIEDISKLKKMKIEGRKVGIKRITLETDKRLRIILHEGRKHIIRDALSTLKYKILRLKRIRIANLELTNVKLGTWRFLSSRELKRLRESFKVLEQTTRPA